MAIERLPEAVRSRSVARAAVSPSTVLVTGAGVALGIVAHLPILVAAAIGAGCWGVRVGLVAMATSRRRRRAAEPEVIDPYAVPDPWRSFVQEALTAQAGFGQAVEQVRPGPLQDRLRQISVRVGDGARECWRVAQLGAGLAATLAGLDPASTSRQLRLVQEERRHAGRADSSGGSSGGSSPDEIDRSEASLAARLQTARRMEEILGRTTDRLRALTAQLDEAVAAAVQLSLVAGDAGDASDAVMADPVAGNVESALVEIETLRRAMEESAGAPITGTPSTS